MAQVKAGDFRRGIKIILDNQPYEMIDNEFSKPGKGQALYRTRLKNLLTGTILDRTYRSGDSLEQADVRKSAGIYSYRDSDSFVFMDNETFEQFNLPLENCADKIKFLKEGSAVDLLFWNEQLIAMTPPQHVNLEITYTEPAARGDTATNVTKNATVETGAEVQVPAFIEEGNVVRVEVETGNYIERVST